MKTEQTFSTKWFLMFFGLMLGIGCAVLAFELWKTSGPRPQPKIPWIRVQMPTIKNAILIYWTQKGKWPASLDELTTSADGEHPLLSKEYLVDPWGEPIRYEICGDNFVIWSSGPDRKIGTEDDIAEGSSESHVEDWKAKHIPGAILKRIRSAIHMYKSEHGGKTPASLDEYVQTVATNSRYAGSYRLKLENLLDEWGEPVEYEHDGHCFIIRSSGLDKTMGTADDVIIGWPPTYVDFRKAANTDQKGKQK